MESNFPLSPSFVSLSPSVARLRDCATPAARETLLALLATAAPLAWWAWMLG